MYLFVAFFFCAILAIVFKWYHMKYKYFDTGLDKITGPKYVPVVGHALDLLQDETILEYLTTKCAEHNGRAAIFIGFIPSVVITDYRLTEHIMSSTTITKKAATYRFIQNWLATGLLLSSGEKWRKRRKMLTPAFHFQILEQFLEVFHSATDVLIKELGYEVGRNGKELDIYPFITLCTLDVICETAMGTKINAQIDKDSTYINCVQKMGKIIMDRTRSVMQQSDITYKFTANYKLEKKCLQVLHSYTDSVIKSRRNQLLKTDDYLNGNVGSLDISGGGAKRKFAFLDVLLRSTIDGKPLSNEDIREEVDTFMFEGHDTTASAVSFALFSIATHPKVQEKIIEEQRTLFGDNRDRPASYQDLQDMKYLDIVIKETLRLYPSVPMFGREVSEDFQFDGMTFKKGLNIAVYAYGMHRNPKYFPDPEKFDPERFSSENYLGKAPYAYIPFAAGPRNCIGQKFAVLEMKSTISKVLRNFELLSTDHKLIIVPEAILKSKNGVRMSLQKRIW